MIFRHFEAACPEAVEGSSKISGFAQTPACPERALRRRIRPISNRRTKIVWGLQRKMVNRQTKKRKRAAYSGRMPVEAILLLPVAFATVGIFTVKIIEAGWEDSSSPVPAEMAALRHDAISPAAPRDTAPQDVAAAGGQDKFSQRSANVPLSLRAAGGLSDGDRDLKDSSNETIVRNGVTIVSPPLLVPVINADAIEIARSSEAVISQRKASKVRKRPHYANRAHAPAHRRVVRPAPFWRITAG